jgi:hypothetical protein
MQLGLNEADTLKSTSILIYSSLEQSFYTQHESPETVLIKNEIKRWQSVVGKFVASVQVLIKQV